MDAYSKLITRKWIIAKNIYNVKDQQHFIKWIRKEMKMLMMLASMTKWRSEYKSHLNKSQESIQYGEERKDHDDAENYNPYFHLFAN